MIIPFFFVGLLREGRKLFLPYGSPSFTGMFIAL